MDGSIVDRFAEVVRLYPHRQAIRDSAQTVTYRQLDALVQQAARLLERHGTSREAPVLLLIGHGLREVVALLAVLRTGRAYVALDPAYPQAYLAGIAADSGAEVVLTTDAHRRLAARLNAAVIVLPELSPEPDLDQQEVSGTAGGEVLCPPIAAEDLASLVYTSGSTGAPKGVMRSHRCSLHRCWLFSTTHRVDCHDRIAHMFSCGFAAAEVDVYGALLNGATLCCYHARDMGPGPFADWLTEERITLLHPPPAFFRHFLAGAGGPRAWPALRVISLSGESLTRRTCEQARRIFPECALENRFSTTETSVVAQLSIVPGDSYPHAVLPVGRPVADKELMLLDPSGNRVAAGAVGEIVVRSRYLSPGYWRQPELTRERFTTCGEGDVEGMTFRTGDLGSFDDAGLLHHLGRADRMVKISGYRVYPQEIEAILADAAEVRAAAVITTADRQGEAHLVAYVVPDRAGLWEETAHRRRLSEALPHYKLPARFVVLDELPVTASGKVDLDALRRATPALLPGVPAECATDACPADDPLSTLWREVLALDGAAVDDDFFALGGDSLKAFSLCAGIEALTGVTLLPATVYECRTFGSLKQRVALHAGQPEWQTLVQVKGASHGPGLFLVHCIAGDTLYVRHLAMALRSDCRVYALQPDTLAGRMSTHHGISEMAAAYLGLVRAAQPAGPYWFGGYSLGGNIAYEMARQLAGEGGEVAGLLLFDSPSPAPYRHLDQQTQEDFSRRTGRPRGPLARWHRRLKTRLKRNLREPLRRRFYELLIRSGGSLSLRRRTDYTMLVNRSVNAAPFLPGFNGPVYLFRSAQLRPLGRAGWEKLCAGTVDVVAVSGSHATLFKTPHLAEVARAVDGILAGSSPRSPAGSGGGQD